MVEADRISNGIWNIIIRRHYVEVADALYSSILVYDELPLPLCLPNKILQMIDQPNFYIKVYVASQRWNN